MPYQSTSIFIPYIIVSHIATHLHEWDFSTAIHDFYVRIPASYSTVKRRDGWKLRLFSPLSLNIKIAATTMPDPLPYQKFLAEHSTTSTSASTWQTTSYPTHKKHRENRWRRRYHHGARPAIRGGRTPSGSVYNGEDCFYCNLKHIDEVFHIT